MDNSKANRNKRWTEEEKKFVTDNYNTLSVKEICEVIGRTEDSIRQFASDQDLTGKNRLQPWTREDLLYVRKNYRKISVTELAIYLGRSKGSIAHKVTEMNAATSTLPEVDTSPIQKGVPYYTGKQTQYRALMNALDVNDSFEFPASERQTIQNCMPHFQDRLFKTKKVDDNTRRIWRVL